MKNSGARPSTPDHLHAALETVTGVLMALEGIFAQLTEEADDRVNVCRQTRQTIESLRHAIAELRLARGEGGAMLALGLVVQADRA